ncbi:MAG TPA: hypothetical protein VLG47_02030 [Candidatus Saccharimonadales bacterium]|nr:hypothetical protein [Candidatus Saccharimonadales bacterium]
MKQAIKTFVVKTHHASIRRIELLKPKARSSSISIAHENASLLLKSIRKYDKENEELINEKFGVRSIPYFVVSSSYNLLFRSVKKSEKIVRTRLHKMRNRT